VNLHYLPPILLVFNTLNFKKFGFITLKPEKIIESEKYYGFELNSSGKSAITLK